MRQGWGKLPVVVFLATTLAAMALCLRPTGAVAQFEGRTLTLVVGTEAGGGYDVYGRAVSRHIGRHLPGKPTVIVQNMPGAGSAKAAEYLAVLAPRDGTTFGIIFPGAIVDPLTAGLAKSRYDPRKLSYLGSADSGTRLCVTYRTSRIETFADTLAKPSNFGGSGPGSSTTDYEQMLVNLAGSRMRIINGYRSSIDTVVAMERGEIDGLCGLDVSSLRAMRPGWFGSPEARLILQAGLTPNSELLAAGVPSIWDFVTGENRKAAEIVIAQQEFHRPFVAPPGTPPAQLALLREAFMATMRDPQFLADATKVQLTIAPKDGETVARLVDQLYASPPELLERLRRALQP